MPEQEMEPVYVSSGKGAGATQLVGYVPKGTPQSEIMEWYKNIQKGAMYGGSYSQYLARAPLKQIPTAQPTTQPTTQEGMTTKLSPTPSAELLHGTPISREMQIQRFRESQYPTMTTKLSPTPSAELLHGTPISREMQIKAFRKVQPPISQPQAQQPTGVLFQKQTGTIQGTPVYETWYKSEVGQERRATQEEADYFREREKAERYREVALGKTTKYGMIIHKVKEKILPTYKTTEESVEEVYTEPVFKAIERVAGVDITSRETERGFADFLQAEKKLIPTLPTPITILKEKYIPGLVEAEAGFKAGFVVEQLRAIREEPLGIGLTFGIGAAVGAGIKGGAYGIKAIGGILGGIKGTTLAAGITSVGITTGGLGLAGLYGYSAIKDISTPLGIEKDIKDIGITMGMKTGMYARDLFVFSAGAYAGERWATKQIGKIRTIGMEEVPKEYREKMFDSDVEAGRKTFPELAKGETAKQLRERFKEPKLPGEELEPAKYRGFTAVDSQLIAEAKTIPVGKPRGATIKSLFPGVYIADETSTYFLRAGEKPVKLFGLFEELGAEPTIVRREVLDIVLPKTEGGKLSKNWARIKEISGLLGGRKGMTMKEIETTIPKLEVGKAAIDFTKTERQAIIVKETPEKIIGKKWYVKVKGIDVPIIQKAVDIDLILGAKETGFKNIINKISKNIEKVSSSYGSMPKYSVITPVRAGISLAESYKEPTIKELVSYKAPSISSIKSYVSSSEKTIMNYALSPYKKEPVSYKSEGYRISEIIGYEPVEYKKPYKPPYKTPPYKPPYKTPPYKPPYKTPPYKPPYRIPPYNPPYHPPPKYPPYYPPIKKYGGEKRRKMDLSEAGFDLGLVEKGRKPRIVARGLGKKSALSLGTKEILQDLRATFFIKPSRFAARDLDLPDYFTKYGKKLRKPTAKSRYRKLGMDVYVQKQTGFGGRLFSLGEKQEIKSYRKKKKIRIGFD